MIRVLYISSIFLITSLLFACKNNKKSSKEYTKGKKLFLKYCDECHNKNMIHDMTAPALGFALEKRDSSWFKYYIKKGMYASLENDSIALTLRDEGWGAMPSYDFLTEKQIQAIIIFIRKEFNKNKK